MKILIYKPYFLSQQENSHLSGKTDQTEKKKKKNHYWKNTGKLFHATVWSEYSH